MLDEILRVIWNTFLALVPVALGYMIYWLARSCGKHALSKLAILVLGVAWLAFLPNACYLLTEWRHFLNTVGYSNLYARWQVESSAALRLMMYTLFYLSWSAVGMLAFAVATRPIAQLVRGARLSTWMLGMPFFLLMSVGVYLGLVLRFNSWELVSKTGEIWASVVSLTHRPMLSSLIILFAGFLWVAYAAVDVWIDGFTLRYRGKTFE